MTTTATKAPRVIRKPEDGRGKATIVTLTDLDRKHLAGIQAGYLQGLELKPSMSLTISIALGELAAMVRQGELPKHPSLRKGIKRRAGE
jgi:hypothetical protein